ncbi:MAG: stage V sporulation protein SpoVM [Clostridia bacterium]|nr:stage V sporulation protein SpoVM [Clostridia bacterium]
MKIVLIKSPRILSPLLRRLFGIKKGKRDGAS